MYGMPQPNQYAQFGYSYPGFPGQAAAGQQPTGTPAAGTAQLGAVDPSQAQAQPGQQQWTQDQNAYAAYAAQQQQQPYWGGTLFFEPGILSPKLISFFPCSQVTMVNSRPQKVNSPHHKTAP